MKKFLALILSALITLSLTACGNSFHSNLSQGSGKPNGITATENGTNKEENQSHSNKSLCTRHTYVNNICSVCKCSLWTGNVDTSWYSYSLADIEFTISTAEHFAGLINLTNSGITFEKVTITLANHIDMNEIPIASMAEFAGNFEGNNYSISNVVINSANSAAQGSYGSPYAGLFGHSTGKISNLAIKNISVNLCTEEAYAYNIGGLAATCNEVENCSVQGKISVKQRDSYNIGGLASSASGNITKCSTDVLIVADASKNIDDSDSFNIAGLIARAPKTVSKCFSKGSIAFTHNEGKIADLQIGGLVAEVEKSRIINCYSTVDITASTVYCSSICSAGGLIGGYYIPWSWVNVQLNVTVDSCYSTGNISLNNAGKGANAGGLIGIVPYSYYDYYKVNNCFAVGNVHCNSDVSNGIAGNITSNDTLRLEATNCYYLNEQLLTCDKNNQSLLNTPASQSDLTNPLFYKNRLPWDSSIWDFTKGSYPTLK